MIEALILNHMLLFNNYGVTRVSCLDLFIKLTDKHGITAMDIPERNSYFFPQQCYKLLNGCYLHFGLSYHPRPLLTQANYRFLF